MSLFTRYLDGLAVSGRRARPTDASAGDDPLLRRAARGDEDACRAFVLRHGPKLGAIVQAAHGDLQLTDDIVQESFIRAIRSAHQLTTDASVFPWLVRIATRVAIDHRRKRRRETLTNETPDSVSDERDSPERQVQAHQSAERLRQTIQGLNPKTRELLVLRYYSSFSVAELAQVFDKSEAAIRKDLQRARRRLRRQLGPWFQEEHLR